MTRHQLFLWFDLRKEADASETVFEYLWQLKMFLWMM